MPHQPLALSESERAIPRQAQRALGSVSAHIKDTVRAGISTTDAMIAFWKSLTAWTARNHNYCIVETGGDTGTAHPDGGGTTTRSRTVKRKSAARERKAGKAAA